MNIQESRGCWEQEVSVLCGRASGVERARPRARHPITVVTARWVLAKERLVAPTTQMHSPKYVRSAMRALTSTAAKNESFPTNTSWPGQKTKGVKKCGLVSDLGAGLWPMSCYKLLLRKPVYLKKTEHLPTVISPKPVLPSSRKCTETWTQYVILTHSFFLVTTSSSLASRPASVIPEVSALDDK